MKSDPNFVWIRTTTLHKMNTVFWISHQTSLNINYVMPKHLQPFPSNISSEAFSAWSRVHSLLPFLSISLLLSGSDVVYIRLKNTGPVDYYSTAELQAVQIRLCRSPIWNWQRHSPSLPILYPLTSPPAWNRKLRECWAAIRTADWLLQCFLLQTVQLVLWL